MEEQEIGSVNYLKLKYPKQKSDTQAIAVIILKLEQPESQWFYHSVMRHRDGMANSADQDQSALGLHCFPRPVRLLRMRYLGLLRYFTGIMVLPYSNASQRWNVKQRRT